jgi:hypothetical protein
MMRVHTRTVWDIETGRVLEDESYEYSGPVELCNGGSGVKKDAFASYGTATNNANSLYGTLDPTLTTMATNPQGINPADMAKIQTSNMQTAGGANAGAVGQGSLLAARTKNAGTADAAIAKSGENASQTLSRANLGTQIENQGLKQQQQKEGVQGLESLYGTNVGAGENYLKTAEQAPLTTWQQLAKLYGTNAVNNLNGPGAAAAFGG